VQLSAIFIWILLATTFAASSRWNLFMVRLFEVKRIAAMATPLIAFIAAGLYYLVSSVLAPSLWPGGNAPFAITILLFSIVFLGFAGHSVLLNSYAPGPSAEWLARNGHRVTLIAYGLSSAGLFLLWFALAFPVTAS